MEGAEVTRGLADIADPTHDRDTNQAASRRQALSNDARPQPEQPRPQGEAITEQLRRTQSEAVGELAEDAQGAEATGRADDEGHAGRASIRGRGHADILRRPAIGSGPSCRADCWG